MQGKKGKPCVRGTLAVTLAAALYTLPATAQNPTTALELPKIEVIGTTPLPGIGVPIDRVPANVQGATSEDLRQQKPRTLADYLNQNMSGVHINEAQSNPFQPDVSFRGFTASPLLGNPIGISVFVDGVRVNESFGDTVFWDLIPTNAISAINLIPGSNPVFGLNTLGGALSVRTKSGRYHPGVEAEIAGGSFGRRSAEVSLGGGAGDFDGFIAAQYYEEDGWRDRSPSRVKQLFGKVGWETGSTDFDLSYTYASNKLIGNGLAPEPLLQARREAIYTYADETAPELNFVNLTGSHAFNDKLVLSGNVYYRRLKVATFNGDAEYDNGDTPDNPSDDEYQAENRRTEIDQRTTGAGLQVAYAGNLGGLQNQLTVGVSHDRGRADFSQLGQSAEFTADRGTVGQGDFVLGTKVRGSNEYDGIYITDTLSVTDSLHVTLAGRHNRARAEIEDRTGEQPELNGNHRFSRFNPAIGATWTVAPAVTLYGGYNEGFRVPTPVELTCADPEAPCSLPVSFVADPPLNPVVSKAWELGVRGTTNGLRWNATGYRTNLENDILFTAVGGSQGFFGNVPKTRRQGIELSIGGKARRLNWYANYAYVEATFESAVDLFNPVATATDPSQPATIRVSAGNKLPGMPEHLFKVGGDFRLTDAFSLGANVIYTSDQFFRGDENNSRDKLSGYTVMNLRAGYQITDSVRLYAKVDNVFDKEYATLGAFNRTAFDAASVPLEGVGAGPVQRFVSPGTPRSYWVGVEIGFGSGGGVR